MAVYTVKSEITDILIVNHIEDDVEWGNWLETYLLRADKWFIERAAELSVEESSIITYAQGQRYGVISLLRYWVYIEVLTEMRANGDLTTDDYNTKIKGDGGYQDLFDKANNKLSYEVVIGELPKVNPVARTGRRIMLDADY